MPKEEREPLFIEMFRGAKPFEEGVYYKSETFQKMEYVFAFWDIELIKRLDGEGREAERKKVSLRASMETYRDYHYFVQGIDCLIEYLRTRLPELDQLIEGVHTEDTEKEPL